MFWIYPRINHLIVVTKRHWVDLQAALFAIFMHRSYASLSSKYGNDALWVPAVMNQRICSPRILVPNYTVWIARWIGVVVKTARYDKAGVQQSFDVAWHVYVPSMGNKEKKSCKKQH